MPANSASIDRISPTRRPAERAVGYHRWTDLLFVHWRFPAEAVQPLLPEGLTLDTWDGDALIGLVPFYMSRVRPWWAPPLPGLSYFCETNVRTYVHHQGRDPGVWFFSLEAACSLAVRIARWRWRLPYHRAEMQLHRDGAQVRYFSRRRWPGAPGAGCRIEATVGERWHDASMANNASSVEGAYSDAAVPGTLEHFLIERYILYAHSAGRLLKGRVHHRPYPLRHIGIDRLEDTLLDSNGLSPRGDPFHALFSDGVDVEVFPLRAADASGRRTSLGQS